MDIFSMTTVTVIAAIFLYGVYKSVKYFIGGGAEDRYVYIQNSEGQTIKIVDLKDTQND